MREIENRRPDDSIPSTVPPRVDPDSWTEGWLRETTQLDISDAKLRITAQKLTQARQSHAARAAAIHDFVRRMPFAAAADGGSRRAGEVLRDGRGDCHSKGVLFTALCRAADIPARLQFVRVKTRFMAGILPEAPPAMPHAVGQVLLDGQWLSTDGYVVDPVLFARARRLLDEFGESSGWGIIAGSRGRWDGTGDCLQQFELDDVLENYGVFHDAAHFYGTRGEMLPGWVGSLKYAVGAQLVNRRVAQVRRGEGPEPRGPAVASA